MAKKITRDEQERRELRVHSSIQEARELGIDNGTPTTKAAATHLGITFRKTLERLCLDLYGPPKSKVIERAAEKGVTKEPEPESAEPHVVKGTSAGSSNDHQQATTVPEELESIEISPRSSRYSCGVSTGHKSITYEEAVRLQSGFGVASYLVVYPPEAIGDYVGSWIKVQLLFP